MMKRLKRAGALVLALAMSLAMLAGCSKTPASDFQVPDSVDLSAVTDPYLTVSGLSGDTPVATMADGQEITASQALYWIAFNADNLSKYYGQMGIAELPWDSDFEGATMAESMKRNALETAALYTLLPQKAKEAGLELPQEFQTTFQEALTKMNDQLGGEEATNHYLWQFPLTREQYISMCESEEFNGLLLEQMFGKDSEGYPTDANLLSFLEEEQKCYFFKHILLKVDDNDPESADKQKAKMEDLLAQIKASDDPITKFDQLMNEHSEDGRGPDRALAAADGYLASTRQDAVMGTKMVDVVEKAALGLDEGEVSEILENTQGYHGYHIVLRLPVEGNVSMEQARSSYIADRMNKQQQEWIDQAKLTPTDAFKALDPAKFYEALGVLRKAISEEAAAKANPDSAAPDASKPDASAPDSSQSQSAEPGSSASGSQAKN